MGNHPCEKFPQENYNVEDILHIINRRRSESSMMALEEEDINYIILFNLIIYNCLIKLYLIKLLINQSNYI